MTEPLVSGWPKCAKCNAPVESFSREDFGGRITFTAFCHGMQQSFHIGYSDVKNATRPLKFHCATAFEEPWKPDAAAIGQAMGDGA